MLFLNFKRVSATLQLASFMLYSQILVAQESGVAKSRYGFFERTPADLLRPMEADRPDITESPKTVDAGWYQVELSFVEWSKNGEADQALRIPSANFKVGLTSRSDLQIILNGVDSERSDLGDESTYLQDSRLRWKYNLIGNDSGDFALGTISTLLIPSGPSSDESYQPEGALAFPWSYELSPLIELMGQTEFQLPRRGSDTDYGTEYLQTLGFGYPIFYPLSGYLEQIFFRSLDQGREAQHISSFGFIYEVSANLTFDLGAQLGVSASAPDHLLFSGMTARF